MVDAPHLGIRWPQLVSFVFAVERVTLITSPLLIYVRLSTVAPTFQKASLGPRPTRNYARLNHYLVRFPFGSTSHQDGF